MSFLKDMGGWFKAEKKEPALPVARPQANRQELEELRRQKELADLRAFRDLKVTDTAIKTFCLNFPQADAQLLSAGLKTMTKAQRDFVIGICNQAVTRLSELSQERQLMDRIMPDQLAKAQEASQTLLKELESMNPDNYNFKDLD